MKQTKWPTVHDLLLSLSCLIHGGIRCRRTKTVQLWIQSADSIQYSFCDFYWRNASRTDV